MLEIIENNANPKYYRIFAARPTVSSTLRRVRKNNNYMYRVPNKNIARGEKGQLDESRASDVGLGANPENPENCLRRGLKQQ